MSELERIEKVLQEMLQVLIDIRADQKLVLAALTPSYPQSTGGTITVKSA